MIHDHCNTPEDVRRAAQANHAWRARMYPRRRIVVVEKPPSENIVPPPEQTCQAPLDTPGEVAPMMITITMSSIALRVSKHLGINRDEMFSKRRSAPLIRARYLMWLLIKKYQPQRSLTDIGRFSNRDHTTVLHGLQKYAAVSEQLRLISQPMTVVDIIHHTRALMEAHDNGLAGT